MARLPGREILSTRCVFVAIVVVGLFAMAAGSVTDPDVWWHLRTGQLTLANRAVFHTDPYSFTRAGEPWINHEWLFDVFLYLLYRAGGWGGLILAFAAITSVSFLLLFVRCAGRPYIAGVVAIWAALASIPLWGVRPQMISLLLVSVLLVVRDRARNHPALWWWMVPVMLLWVNLHAAYALGIALMALFLAGEALDIIFGFQTWAASAPYSWTLSRALLACAAVVPLNPYGLKMYGYPVATLRSAAMQRYIAEWFSPNFHQPNYLPLLLFLLASIVATAALSRRMRPSGLLLLAVTMVAALHSVRHAPIYVLVAAPLLCEAAQRRVETRAPFRSAKPTRASLRSVAVPNGALLLVCAIAAAIHVRAVILRQPQVEAASFPSTAVSFLHSSAPSRALFNSYDWGGYLIWKLFPQRVFIDGRADLYGDTFMEQYSNTYYVTRDWQQSLDRWKIQTVVVPSNAPLLAVLQSTGGWKTEYSDPQATVLCRLR